MMNNSHQYKQSEQSSLNSDGQQFTQVQTKRIITSKQWWSTIHTNINKANNHLYLVMVNNSHQYQQGKQPPLNSDGQQFTLISTKRTHISKTSDGQQFHQYQHNKQSPLTSDGQQFTPISTKWTITSK